jgi:hypothetical protein
MTTKTKKNSSGANFLQLRIVRGDKRGAQLIAKIEKISELSGLSMNDVGNLGLAAGLPMVETQLGKIHEPAKELEPA